MHSASHVPLGKILKNIHINVVVNLLHRVLAIHKLTFPMFHTAVKDKIIAERS